MIGKIDCLCLFVRWIFKIERQEKEPCSNIVLIIFCKVISISYRLDGKELLGKHCTIVA
jgi:hypothetical protein